MQTASRTNDGMYGDRMGDVLAEAGLSECTHAGICGGPSAASVTLILVGFLALSASVAASMVATYSILNAPDPASRPRLTWIFVVWVVPLIGAGLLWLHTWSVKRT